MQGLFVQNIGFVSAVIFTEKSVLCLFLQGARGDCESPLAPCSPLTPFKRFLSDGVMAAFYC